jgi:hypothetical protein
VSQDSVNDVLVLYTSYDSDESTAAAANLDINFENSLEPLGPCHRRVALGG